MMNDQLTTLRQSIDVIDEELIGLLARRSALTDEVGQVKKVHALPAVDATREAAQMARIEQLAVTHGLEPELAQKFLRAVIDEVVVRHKRI